MPSAMPPSDMMFKDTPKIFMGANVATMEMGIARLTMPVCDGFRRKTYSTRMARMPPMIAVCFTSSMDRFNKLRLVRQHFHLHSRRQRIADEAGHFLQFDELPHLRRPVRGFGLFDFSGPESLHVGQLFRCAEQTVPYPLRRGDDIRVGFLEDIDFHTLHAVDAGDDLSILVAANNVAHVSQPDIRAVFLSDNEIADFVHRPELVEGAHHVLGLAVQKTAPGEVDVLFAKTSVDVADAEPHQGELPFVDFNADFLLPDPRARVPRPPLSSLPAACLISSLGNQSQRIQIGIAVKTDAHDGILRGIVTQNQGFVDAPGHVQPVQVLPHRLNRVVHVRVPAEFKDDVRHPRTGNGDDAGQIVDNAQPLFDLPGNQVFLLPPARYRDSPYGW